MWLHRTHWLAIAVAASAAAEATTAADTTELGAAAFVVEDDSFGEGAQAVRLKVLRNRLTGERAEVAWSAGGRTEALVLRSPSGQLREVLLNSNRSAGDVRKNVGWKGAMLAPFVNRIRNGSYRLHGHTYHLPLNEDRGRYGKNSIHGLLYSKSLRVEHASGGSTSARLTLQYDFEGEDTGYPFPLSIALSYVLDASGFTVKTRAWHREAQGLPLPFFNSWHPYFLVSDVSRVRLRLDGCSPWNRILLDNNSNIDGDMIPTGETEPFALFDGRAAIGGSTSAPTYYDDEFKATAPEQACPLLETRISDTVTGETSVLWADAQYRWVQVYTGAVKALGKQAVVVEPMSGQCDSWNNLQGIRLLQAGEVWEGSFGVYLEAEEAEQPAFAQVRA